VLLSSGDNFPHLIQKRRSQLGFVTYLLNYPRKRCRSEHVVWGMSTARNLVLPAATLGNLRLVINVNLSRSTPRRHRGSMAPLFLNLDSRQRRKVSFNEGSFIPAKEPLRSRPGRSTFRNWNHKSSDP